MIAENPLALAYILPGDVYLLNSESSSLSTFNIVTDIPEQILAVAQQEAPIQVEEPAIAYIEPTPIEEQAAVQHSPPTPQIATPIIETPVTAFNYLGGFRQKFLIVVHYPDHEVMQPAHLNALENTIKRRGLSLDEVAIFNIAQYPKIDLKAIGKFFKPQKMLLLGQDALPSGLETPPINLLTKLGKCDMLYSFSFGQMMGNKEGTKAFWEQMKML